MRVLGRLQTGGNASAVAVLGPVVYVGDVVPPEFPPLMAPLRSGPLGLAAAAGCSLVVVDASDPAAPREIDRQPLNAMAVGPLLAHGGRLYLNVGWYGGPWMPYGSHGTLAVFDVAVPTAPALVATLDADPSTWLAAEGDVLYEAGYWGGLRTLDVSGPDKPRILGAWRAPMGPRSVAAADGYVYLGDHALGGLWAVDARRTDAAMPLAFVHGPGDLFCGADCALAAANGMVYVADSNSGLVVFRATPPQELRQTSTLNIRGNGNWMDIAVTGGTAFLVVDEGDVSGSPLGGIFVLDVSDWWRQPVPIAHIAGFRPYRVAVDEANPLLLSVDLKGDLWVVDVADSAQPSIIAHLPLGDGATGDVAARDGYAYVSGRNGALSVVDLHQPAAPRRIGFVAPGEGSSSMVAVSLMGHLALVNGQRLLDISVPESPVVVSQLGDAADWRGGRPVADHVAGDGVFVLADEGRGVFFGRPTDPSLAVRTFLPWGGR